MLSKGLAYEKVAEKFLQKHGLKSITKNFRSKFGEIDLVMEDKGTLIFVEVRFRSKGNYGEAADTITKSKRQKLVKTANFYLSQHKLWSYPCRFDVVSINKNTLNQTENIDWIQSAFYAH